MKILSENKAILIDTKIRLVGLIVMIVANWTIMGVNLDVLMRKNT